MENIEKIIKDIEELQRYDDIRFPRINALGIIERKKLEKEIFDMFTPENIVSLYDKLDYHTRIWLLGKQKVGIRKMDKVVAILAKHMPYGYAYSVVKPLIESSVGWYCKDPLYTDVYFYDLVQFYWEELYSKYKTNFDKHEINY